MTYTIQLPAIYFAPNPSEKFVRQLKELNPSIEAWTVRTGGVGALLIVLSVSRRREDGKREWFRVKGYDSQQAQMEETALNLVKDGAVWTLCPETPTVVDLS